MRRTLATLLIACPLCLGPTWARTADLEEDRPTQQATLKFFPDFGERQGFLGRREAHPFDRLGLFVERKALPVGLRTIIFDIEGGATLKLLHNLRLTGSYRMLDYDVDTSGSGVVSQHAGPCIGLSLRF